jgi:hypothetical protein
MVELKISRKWEMNKDFKVPFYYLVGKGVITEEQVEAYDGDNQIVRIVRLDMADVLKLGLAEEMDFMSRALMSSDAPADKDGEANAAKALENAIKKAANFAKMEIMINKIVQKGIVEPKIYEKPEHENARQKGLFYVDAISFEDRMELFSVIFETEGLSDFRQEQETGVGNVADVQGISLSADGPVAELRP